MDALGSQLDQIQSLKKSLQDSTLEKAQLKKQLESYEETVQ